MILKRERLCAVAHPETGLTFDVYRVDCFVEQHHTEGLPTYIFDERFYETENGQKVIEHSDNVFIVQTEIGNWYVKKCSES